MLFLDLIEKSPLPTNGERATNVLASLAGGDAADLVDAALKDDRGRAFLEGVFDGSPFLGHAATIAPDALETCLAKGPDAALEAAIALMTSAAEAPNLQRAMSALRQGRIRAALTIGLADLSGAWTTMETTGALTRAADAAIQSAVAWLLQDAAKRNVLELPDGQDATDGFVVLGMGKLGAFELNYSSDVDLILLYDAERIPMRRPDRLQHEMTRIARALAPLLEDRTRDGYAYRTDLRLRPDPASTPPAVSIRAAEAYYESTGQNWERAAMIKARPVAGDIAAGEAFLADLRPFVWRRSLDFNAIRDIQAIKRQIDAGQTTRGPTAFEHNVKLGRGGIREVEFYAQTQQLIWGGRDPNLRPRETLAALEALALAGHVKPETAADLADAYQKLRDVEHRLQMIDDRQTHITPDEAGMPAFARFCGFETTDGFVDWLEGVLRTVEAHYADLYAEEAGLGSGGPLSFTGADEHPDTLKTIEGLGYKQPERIAHAIRGWHHGRVRAMRDRRAREILTELTPEILSRFGATIDPDRSFAALERFVAGLPEGVQFFSLLDANRELLEFLARVLGRSAYLAELVGRRPHVIDAALDDEFMRPPGEKRDFAEELERESQDALDLQDRLDCARRWLNDTRLRLGVQTIEAALRPARASEALADAADLVADAMLKAVEDEFSEAHGRIEGGAYGVMAYGKWGSRERTIGSDLDLVAVYDAPEGAQSDGGRSLPAPVYYMRLTQRLATAMTTATGEGRLFQIDMRLRPTGEDGPIATHIETMRSYFADKAWTWELMALSRARFAMGDLALGKALEALRLETLAAAPGRPDLLEDVASMRARIAAAKPAGGPWDIRNRPGGMVDLEFIAQGLAIRHADKPGVVHVRRPANQLRALGDAGVLDPGEADTLADAATFWLEAQWLLRLIGHDEGVGAELDHPDAKATFAAVFKADSYDDLARRREENAEAVQAAYARLLPPARSAG